MFKLAFGFLKILAAPFLFLYVIWAELLGQLFFEAAPVVVFFAPIALIFGVAAWALGDQFSTPVAWFSLGTGFCCGAYLSKRLKRWLMGGTTRPTHITTRTYSRYLDGD